MCLIKRAFVAENNFDLFSMFIRARSGYYCILGQFSVVTNFARF